VAGKSLHKFKADNDDIMLLCFVLAIEYTYIWYLIVDMYYRSHTTQTSTTIVGVAPSIEPLFSHLIIYLLLFICLIIIALCIMLMIYHNNLSTATSCCCSRNAVASSTDQSKHQGRLIVVAFDEHFSETLVLCLYCKVYFCD